MVCWSSGRWCLARQSCTRARDFGTSLVIGPNLEPLLFEGSLVEEESTGDDRIAVSPPELCTAPSPLGGRRGRGRRRGLLASGWSRICFERASGRLSETRDWMSRSGDAAGAHDPSKVDDDGGSGEEMAAERGDASPPDVPPHKKLMQVYLFCPHPVLFSDKRLCLSRQLVIEQGAMRLLSRTGAMWGPPWSTGHPRKSNEVRSPDPASPLRETHHQQDEQERQPLPASFLPRSVQDRDLPTQAP